MVPLKHFYIQASDIHNTEEGNNSILPNLNGKFKFTFNSSFLENLLPSKVCAYTGNLIMVRLAPWNGRYLPNTSVDFNIGIQ